MNSRVSFISCASIALAGSLLVAGCGGGDDDGLEPPLNLVIPSDADAGADQRPQVTLTVSNGAGVDGTIFHRKDAGFVFQGGGFQGPVAPTDNPVPKQTNPPIPLEIKVSNVQGTVAMARTSALNSATSQFFINLGNNTFLDYNNGGYAAFGYITDMTFVAGMAQAPCVSAVVTGGGSLGCLPVPNLVIVSAEQTRGATL